MEHISEAGVKKICEICDRYANEKTPLMMILSDIQNEYGYIPLDVQQLVSEKTGISVAEIYGVVTFYSFFSLEPKGKYVIGCCLGTACYVKVRSRLSINSLNLLVLDQARHQKMDYSLSMHYVVSVHVVSRQQLQSTEKYIQNSLLIW